MKFVVIYDEWARKPLSLMQGMNSLFSLDSYFVESSAQSKSSRVRFRELLRDEKFQL